MAQFCTSDITALKGPDVPSDAATLPPTIEMEILVDHCLNQRVELILGCDSNSHHLSWGSKDMRIDIAYKETYPMRMVQTDGATKTWWCSELEHLRKRARTTFNKAKRTIFEEDWDIYQANLKEVKKVCRQKFKKPGEPIFIVFAAFVAVTRAGILPAISAPLSYAAPAYSAAPAVSYSSISAPVATYAAAAPAYAKLAAPAFAYSAPLSYAAPAVAKVAYSAAPAVSYSSVSTPIRYAAPAIAKIAAPVSYAAPALSYAAPAYKVAAPVSYAAPALSYAAPALRVAAPVSYAAPTLSYAAPALKVAAPVAYAAPVAKAVIAEPSAPANYDFGYGVNDPHTGDSKSQQESRRGDVVQGSYSLIESDGTKRTVEYTADPHNGFNAVVHKEPAAVAVKTVAPVVAKVAAPLSYAAPAYAASAPAYYH
nr:uncharacterized protein LOC111506993 [Leptinotarsa decemlineata]